MRVLVPTGIGDVAWALHKVQSVRDKIDPGGPIDISLVGGENNIDSRALDFVKRFSFVNSANMRPYEIHPEGTWYHPSGRYNYLEDGLYTFDGEQYCVLIPNAALERGERLESWLPQYDIDWNIFSQFHISPTEKEFGAKILRRVGPYCVFYPGPLNGNTEDGHNRGALWTPQDWVQLGKRIHHELNLQIVVVGAPYDASYYEYLLGPALNGTGHYWTNLIGQTNLGELWSVTSNSKFCVGYQAGAAIIAAYLGTPTCIWWRPEGDTISASGYLSFSEKMAHSWASPKMLESGSYMPMTYKRFGVDRIMSEIKGRKWA